MRHARNVLLISSLLLASCSSVIEGTPVASSWTPSSDNHDPSVGIRDVEVIDYAASVHVGANQRVAYDRTPPAGGPHDAIWAACNGVIYPDAIRTENAVHSLEHGAIWIAYDPEQIEASALEHYVDGQPYIFMSPYPGLDTAISLQAWGHQLQLDDPGDIRIGQFIDSLRVNPFTTPEVGATCAPIPGAFDPANPPPFDAAAPGPDAVDMEGTGADIYQR